jgi:hypothetical protein
LNLSHGAQNLDSLGGPGFYGERSRTISRAVKDVKFNAALQLAEKVYFRRVLVAQPLLPVLCFLLLSHQLTAKSGCATDFFRKLFSRWAFDCKFSHRLFPPLKLLWLRPRRVAGQVASGVEPQNKIDRAAPGIFQEPRLHVQSLYR